MTTKSKFTHSHIPIGNWMTLERLTSSELNGISLLCFCHGGVERYYYLEGIISVSSPVLFIEYLTLHWYALEGFRLSDTLQIKVNYWIFVPIQPFNPTVVTYTTCLVGGIWTLNIISLGWPLNRKFGFVLYAFWCYVWPYVFRYLQITRSDIRPHIKWAITALVIAFGHFNLPQELVWVCMF